MLIAQKTKAAAAEVFGVTVADIEGPCRRTEFTHPRFAVCAALRLRTKWPLRRIGWHMGRRNHATIHNAIRRAYRLCVEDAVFRARLAQVMAATKGGRDDTA